MTVVGETSKTEIRIKARAVSRGIAIGSVVCLYGRTRQFYRRNIPESDIENEIGRLNAALDAAGRVLRSDQTRKPQNSASDIFETHLLILEDKSLLSKIEGEIRSNKANAEWAVKIVFDHYIAKYRSISDEQFSERYIDIEDVGERILDALAGSQNEPVALADGSILVAKDLRPSTLFDLTGSGLAGIITANGGWTSHSFILARETSVPAVTGIKQIFRRLTTGQKVIVDGFTGEIIIDPTIETIESYEPDTGRKNGSAIGADSDIRVEPKTLDGRRITIRANSDSTEAYEAASLLGANGIGLFRSEVLLSRYRRFPTEDEQASDYAEIARAAGGEGVRIRTFDVGVDQYPEAGTDRERNPALGLRALRLGLQFEGQIKTQLRALLRASFQTNIGIVLPMVSGVSEILAVKQIIERERDALRGEGQQIGEPAIGAMIEVPSAVFMAVEIAENSDFLCLGTNDLVQYLLAADRDNESVSKWFRTLHPAVIRSVKKVIQAASRASKSLVICGEMAGSPYYVPVLVGLGATELSMNRGSIEPVANVIAGIAYEEAVELVKAIDGCSTVEEVEGLVDSTAHAKWSHLFPPGFLEIQNA